MNITLDKKNSTFGSLSIQLEEKDYKPRVQKKLIEYSKQAQIKGFRPGKVPVGLVNQMMGENLKAEEVYKLVSEEINNYIKENKLQIVGQPLPAEKEIGREIDWKSQKEFDFTYELGIVPEFDVEVSPKLKFTKSVISVDDKLINETRENLLNQYGENNEVEVSEDKDFLNGKIVKKGSEDEPKSALIPIDKVQKKEKSKFIGAKAGDEIEFKIKKALDDDLILYVLGIEPADLKSVDGVYSFEVEKVSRQKPAEQNQELYDKLFGPGNVTTEEQFNEKLEESIKNNYEKDSDALLYYDVQDKLIDKAKLSLSADFLKRWILESNKEKITEEDLSKNFDKYEREFKWNFIKSKIASKNEIKVEDPEVREKAFVTLHQQYFGGTPLTPEMEEPFGNFVNNYLKEADGNNYYTIYDQVLSDKIFKYVKENITIKEKSVSLDDFKKIVSKK